MTAIRRQPVPWFEAEPSALERELDAVPNVAPELRWADDLDAGGWRGMLPLWPFDRPRPPELGAFVGTSRFTVEIAYSQAHPVVPASVRPLDPEPNLLARTMHSWHLNGDGTLCLLRTADDWDPDATAADLAVKAAGWYLEHLLMEASVITEMTEQGIAGDDRYDHLLSPYIRCGA